MIAQRIGEAIGKFGEPWEREARDFLGETAWTVVQRIGGWPNVCSIPTLKDLQIAQTQWRSIAQVVVKERRATTQFPALPEGQGKVHSLVEALANEVALTPRGSMN